MKETRAVKYKKTEETKETLVQAGTSLFVKEVSFTSRQVAELAMVNHALIAYHFGNFSEFMDSVFKNCLEQLRVEVLPAVGKLQAILDAGVYDEHILEVGLTEIFHALNSPKAKALVAAMSSKKNKPIVNMYARFSAAILEPLYNVFVSLIAVAKNEAKDSFAVAVLAQLMMAQFMAFFRGADLLKKQLGKDDLNDKDMAEVAKMLNKVLLNMLK